MLTQIIRMVVMTAVRELTSASVRKAVYTPKQKEERNTFYKGKKK